MVSTFYPPYSFGGDAIFVQTLSRALVARGHQVEVVHCEDAFRAKGGWVGGEPGAGGDDGVVVHRLRSPWGRLSPLLTQQTGYPLLKADALGRVFAREFDVVNFNNISLVGGPGVLAMAKAPVKLYTAHEHWLTCATHTLWKNGNRACDQRECLSCCIRSGVPPQLWRTTDLVQRSLATVDMLLSPSAFTARQHEQGGLGVPIRVLPTFSGIAPAVVQPQSPGRPRFVFAGRVTRAKGADLLVEVFQRLPQYDLDIVGTGDLEPELKRRCVSTPSIRFLPWKDHSSMASVYGGATALVLPSRAPEVFPLCILEAFACGVPAIVSDAGGSPEAVLRSGAGFVFRDAEELQGAAVCLAEQPELRRSLGRQARESYQRHYCEDRYVRDYLALIEEIRHARAGKAVQPAS